MGEGKVGVRVRVKGSWGHGVIDKVQTRVGVKPSWTWTYSALGLDSDLDLVDLDIGLGKGWGWSQGWSCFEIAFIRDKQAYARGRYLSILWQG